MSGNPFVLLTLNTIKIKYILIAQNAKITLPKGQITEVDQLTKGKQSISKQKKSMSALQYLHFFHANAARRFDANWCNKLKGLKFQEIVNPSMSELL